VEKFQQNVAWYARRFAQGLVARALELVSNDTEIFWVTMRCAVCDARADCPRDRRGAQSVKGGHPGDSGDGHGEEVKRASLPKMWRWITATIPRETQLCGADAAGIFTKLVEGGVCAGAGRWRECFR